MKYLVGQSEKTAQEYLNEAIQIAKQATCERARCGSVIVKDDQVIGRGFNSPPANLASQKRCRNDKDVYDKKVTDKTCCIHAEQRAIFDALKNNPEKLIGARLYFIRLSADGTPVHAGQPYCTICSKLALDVGISEFVLWHERGIGVYETEEYNNLSYEYGK